MKAKAGFPGVSGADRSNLPLVVFLTMSSNRGFQFTEHHNAFAVSLFFRKSLAYPVKRQVFLRW